MSSRPITVSYLCPARTGGLACLALICDKDRPTLDKWFLPTRVKHSIARLMQNSNTYIGIENAYPSRVLAQAEESCPKAGFCLHLFGQLHEGHRLAQQATC